MAGADGSVAERLEAETRKLMARRAALAPTWMTRKRRAELLAEINATLDLYLAAGERE